MVSPPIEKVLRTFTKLIDKKLKQCQCTMKEILIYNNTNVDCVLKFPKTNTKDYTLQYIEHFPKNSILL